jgi:hypothetical protein
MAGPVVGVILYLALVLHHVTNDIILLNEQEQDHPDQAAKELAEVAISGLVILVTKEAGQPSTEEDVSIVSILWRPPACLGQRQVTRGKCAMSPSGRNM